MRVERRQPCVLERLLEHLPYRARVGPWFAIKTIDSELPVIPDDNAGCRKQRVIENRKVSGRGFRMELLNNGLNSRRSPFAPSARIGTTL
jgi:hypothetical protein